MKTFLVLLLTVALNHKITSSLPTNQPCNRTLEVTTVLQQKCSSFASSDKFNSILEIVGDCPHWCQLKEIKSLRKGNEKDVLCLLFSNSLISFCTTSNNATIHVDLPSLSQITAENVCTKLLLPQQKAEFNISAIIPSMKACEIVCSNYDNPSVVTECALAYYFTNHNGSAIVDVTPKTSYVANSVAVDSLHDQKYSAEVVDRKYAIKNVPADIQNKIGADQNSANLNQQIKQLTGVSSAQKKNLNHVPSGEPETVTIAGNSQTNSQKKIIQGRQDDQALPVGVPNIPHLDTAAASQQGSSINAVASMTHTNVTQKSAVSVKSEPSATNLKTISMKDQPELGKGEQYADNIQDHPPPAVHESGAIDGSLAEAAGRENTGSKIEDEEEEAILPKEEETLPNERHNHLGYSRDDEEENTYDEDIGTAEAKSVKKKPITSDEPASFNNIEEMDGESYFFSYFMVVCVLFVLGYVVYHNRQKVVALVLEGKRSKRQYRGRRPNSASYHKLDTNLEEAISSSCNKNSSHVIY